MSVSITQAQADVVQGLIDQAENDRVNMQNNVDNYEAETTRHTSRRDTLQAMLDDATVDG